MNAFISLVVAIVSVAIVAGLVIYGIHAVMGEWSILVWIGLAWCGFMSIMKVVNS